MLVLFATMCTASPHSDGEGDDFVVKAEVTLQQGELCACAADEEPAAICTYCIYTWTSHFMWSGVIKHKSKYWKNLPEGRDYRWASLCVFLGSDVFPFFPALVGFILSAYTGLRWKYVKNILAGALTPFKNRIYVENGPQVLSSGVCFCKMVRNLSFTEAAKKPFFSKLGCCDENEISFIPDTSPINTF